MYTLPYSLVPIGTKENVVSRRSEWFSSLEVIMMIIIANIIKITIFLVLF